MLALHKPLSGLHYLAAGVVAAIVKGGLDRLVFALFERRYSLLLYFTPAQFITPWHLFQRRDWAFAGVLVAVACLFAALGTWLTLRRLRTLGWSPWWTLLFFLPGLNLVFFLVLACARDRSSEPGPALQYSPARVTAIVTVAGFVGSVAAVWALQTYGWGVFFALPFAMGFASRLLSGLSRGPSARIALTSMLLTGSALLAFALEGLLCLLMAAPLALVMGLLGVLLADAAVMAGTRHVTPTLALAVLLAPPALSAAEAWLAPQPGLFPVSTTLVIPAPPEAVWPHVLTFPELPPPQEWLFRAGIAYPLRARIDGHGPGAIRYCEFSTGAFVEPIEVWQAPHLLRFAVTHNPPPMRELSPHGEIAPAHLHGFLHSERGQFALEPLPGGRTLLTGTTWYRHRLWPEAYWRLWSDQILHRIHHRVLHHIASQVPAR